MTLENSAWKRRFEADTGAECYTRRFVDADTLGSSDNLNLPSCPSQMVVTPNAGDGTYALWHSPDAVGGNGSPDSLVVAFSQPVGMLVILRTGTHSCYDTTVGEVVAYGADGAMLGRSPFTLIQDCSDALPALREDPAAAPRAGAAATTAPYTSPYAEYAEAVLPIPSGVTRLVFLPPAVWEFTYTDPYFPDNVQQFTRQGQYSLVFRPDPHALASDVIELTMPDGDSMPPSGTRVTNLAPIARAVAVRVRTAAGEPVAGRVVTLRVVADSLTSGGHSHRQAPSFLGRRPTGAFRVAGTISTTVTVATGADGRAGATYVASVVGGTEVIRATATGADSAQRRLILAVPRIVSVPDTSVHYFMEPTRNHSPGHNYAHAGVIVKVDSLLARYKALHRENPVRFPFDGANGARFKVSAIGLPRGGLYDVNGQWTPVPDGHQWHREGLEVDLNDRGNGQGAESVDGRVEILRLCRTDELSLQLRPRKCIYHFGHFHITYPGVFQ